MAKLEEVNQLLQAEIVKHKAIEQELRQTQTNLLALVENTYDAIWSVDRNCRLTTLNSAFKQQFWSRFEIELNAGMSAIDFLPDELQAFWTDYYDRALEGDRFWIEQHYILNGVTVYLELSFNPILHDSGQVIGVAVFSRDITRHKQTETQLLHDAFHDTLTGLPNRSLFLDRLCHTVELAKRRQNYLFAVLFLDLDQFKQVNDKLGHVAGDQLLCKLARALEACLRPGDTISRFEGDEFVMLLEDLSDVGEAIQAVEQIKERLALPFRLTRGGVFVNASIGVVFGGSDPTRPDELLHYADIAMYRAKAFNKTCHEIFDAAMLS